MQYSNKNLFHTVYRLPYHVGVKALAFDSYEYFYVTDSGVKLETKAIENYRPSMIYEFGNLGIDVPVVDVKFLFPLRDLFLRSKYVGNAHIFAVQDAHGDVYLVLLDIDHSYLVFKLVGEKLYLTKQFNRIVRTKSARY